MAISVRPSGDVRIRINHLFWIIGSFYLLIMGRLVWLQAVNGQYYRLRAAHMRARRIPQPAQRGALLDRDNRPLAVTFHSSILVCDPTKVAKPDVTAQALQQLLGADLPSVRPALEKRLLKNGQPDRYVVIPVSMNVETADQFRAVAHSKKWAAALAGIAVVDKPERTWPAGRETAHLVGFTAPDEHGKPAGKMGLEKSLDEELRGRDGYVRAELDIHSVSIPDTEVERHDAVEGRDVRLTIDTTIQHIAQTELAECVKKYSPVGATAIVLDPKTGDVLAMVSQPDFDPATLAELKVKDSPAYTNRAVALFEPGSTMKLVTAAAALEEHVITPSTPFNCNGSVVIGKRAVKCASHGGSSAHGHETIREVIAHSCNVASAEIGAQLGMDRLEKYLRAFGLLDQTGVGLPGDHRGRLGFGNVVERGVSKVSRVAFGQSVMVTPLAMAAAYGAIANNGLLMKPRLVRAYADPSGKVLKEFKPEAVRQAIKPETATYLRELLEGVVAFGTGKPSAQVPGYSAAGKTGTAQKVLKGEHGYSGSKYVASFIGFLPAKNPRAVVYIVVDEPHGEYYGAQVAAPVFKNIAQRLMWYWKVPPDDPASLQAANSKLASR